MTPPTPSELGLVGPVPEISRICALLEKGSPPGCGPVWVEALFDGFRDPN